MRQCHVGHPTLVFPIVAAGGSSSLQPPWCTVITALAQDEQEGVDMLILTTPCNHAAASTLRTRNASYGVPVITCFPQDLLADERVGGGDGHPQ